MPATSTRPTPPLAWHTYPTPPRPAFAHARRAAIPPVWMSDRRLMPRPWRSFAAAARRSWRHAHVGLVEQSCCCDHHRRAPAPGRRTALLDQQPGSHLPRIHPLASRAPRQSSLAPGLHHTPAAPPRVSLAHHVPPQHQQQPQRADQGGRAGGGGTFGHRHGGG